MKLKTWLKAGRGRAAALAKHLGVTKSMVSQMAAEKAPIPIPPTMYRRIKEFTGGEVDFEDMIPSGPVPEPPQSERRKGPRRAADRGEPDRRKGDRRDGAQEGGHAP